MAKGCPDDFVFYEKSEHLGNWAPLYHNGRAFESACHILSLPSKKIYQKMIDVGFDLVEIKQQPLIYNYSEDRFSKYFKANDCLHYAKKMIQEYKFSEALKKIALYNEKFYYFRRGSFELNNNLKKPKIISEDVRDLSIIDQGVLVNNNAYEKVYATPGMILDNYRIGEDTYPFTFKKKKSVHLFVYIPNPRFDISYIRIDGLESFFRISRADYSDSNYYLLAGDWDQEITKDGVDQFFKKLGFCEKYEIIKKSIVTDHKSTTKITNDRVEYIYWGGKNLMAAAAQIFT